MAGFAVLVRAFHHRASICEARWHGKGSSILARIQSKKRQCGAIAVSFVCGASFAAYTLNIVKAPDLPALTLAFQ